jgi:hypothetical protein
MERIEIIDGNYYAVIDNSDCNAPDAWVLIQLGPQEPYSDDVPF